MEKPPDAKGDVQRGLEVVEYCIGTPQMQKVVYRQCRPRHRHVLDEASPWRLWGNSPIQFPGNDPVWMLLRRKRACGNAYFET